MKIKRFNEMVNESDDGLDLSKTKITIFPDAIYFDTPFGQYKRDIISDFDAIEDEIPEDKRKEARIEFKNIRQKGVTNQEDFKKIFEILDLYIANMVNAYNLEFQKLKQKYTG